MSNPEKPNEFAKTAIDTFRIDLLDAFFLFIEYDPELLEQYQKLVEDGFPKSEIHSLLSKGVTKEFDLNKAPVSCSKPKSSLISEYRMHE